MASVELFQNYFDLLGVTDETSYCSLAGALAARVAEVQMESLRAPDKIEEYLNQQRDLFKAHQVLSTPGSWSEYINANRVDFEAHFELVHGSHLVETLPEDRTEDGVRKQDSPTPAPPLRNPTPSPPANPVPEVGEINCVATACPDISFAPVRQEINSGVAIGVVASDPIPSRVVYAAFNEKGSVMRRTDGKDRWGSKVSVLASPSYWVLKRGWLRREDVRYSATWEFDDDEEGECVWIFNELKREGKTTGWGWTDWYHMRADPGLRPRIQKAYQRLKQGAYYNHNELFNGVSVGDKFLKDYLRGMAGRSKILQQRVAEADQKLAEAQDGADIRLQCSSLYTEMERLYDGMTVELGLIREKAASWKA